MPSANSVSADATIAPAELGEWRTALPQWNKA